MLPVVAKLVCSMAEMLPGCRKARGHVHVVQSSLGHACYREVFPYVILIVVVALFSLSSVGLLRLIYPGGLFYGLVLCHLPALSAELCGQLYICTSLAHVLLDALHCTPIRDDQLAECVSLAATSH